VQNSKKQLCTGLGDRKPIGNGVWELRIDHGPGYRVYYAKAGRQLVLLLSGGDKRQQQADIEQATECWLDYQRRANMNRSRSHDQSVIEMIRNDPAFAVEYLRLAFEELDADGGEAGFLTVLRHVIEARGGMAEIAEKTGLSRESLYCSLSPKGNPTLRTMKRLVHATGLTFASITTA